MPITPHGSDCRCEDCLGARIIHTADVATGGRTFDPLWARLLRYEARQAEIEQRLARLEALDTVELASH